MQNLETFRQPLAMHRGTPFWSWNNKLNQEQLLRQIDVFKTMGMGGFHIHCRTGMGTEYLGEEYMAIAQACTQKAAELGMLTWLYDEDRWPSGYGGGKVTKDPSLRARYLLFTRVPYGQGNANMASVSNALGSRAENGILLARYEVILREGCLHSYRRLGEKEEAAAEGQEWYAYLETARPSAWFNNQTYGDTLNPKATERFIEVTHEAYAQALGQHFGTNIPAMFTDEPQFIHKTGFQFPEEQRDVFLPFTTDLLESFQKAYGQKLEDHLPEIFWELPGKKASVARYRYHDHVCERFASAYADVLGKWCREHGIWLTGHMMEEPRLKSQTSALGEAMRSYRSFDLPGIDMLCDWREYTTAKQAQSASHQYGRSGVLSELYGVTNWDFDFVGHKGQGDWQAALGVTVRVHHLTWVSMEGEAKRDYPASIGYQSPWHTEYKLVEDHFARVNSILTRGKAVCRVGVIHPIESFWLCFGPLSQNAIEQEEREDQFQDLTKWLLFGLIDFDFICESLLPSQNSGQKSKSFQVGEMNYDVIVVPSMRTIRASTLERLEAFVAAGGQVVFTGEIPTLVDAQPSQRPAELAQKSQCVSHSRGAILTALEPIREIGVRLQDSSPADSLLSQVREENGTRYVFLCNTDRKKSRDKVRIQIKGSWKVTQLDTFQGTDSLLATECQNGKTEFTWSFAGCESLLLMLDPGWVAGGKSGETTVLKEVARVEGPVPVSLSEPNVLLLDQARWKWNEEAWQPLEEILRLENEVSRKLGLSPRSGEGVAQPWTDKAAAPMLGKLSLEFTIQSDVDVEGAQLALENVANTQITLDGLPVDNVVKGWWVDEAIQTVALPPIKAGKHVLSLTVDFNRKTQLEWCYLLGDFGVKLEGRSARIIPAVKTLGFGDWTSQGLPFYAGNVTYHTQINEAHPETWVQMSQFKGPLVTVDYQQKPVGPVAFPPFELKLPTTGGNETGKLDITVYGNRINSFGAVHNTDSTVVWAGAPGTYRTQGSEWAYEYQLRPMGLLVAPVLKTVVT
jgi:hypothetical protein